MARLSWYMYTGSRAGTGYKVHITAVEKKQAVRVATQYASAPCKLTVYSYLFARWHLLRHVGYLRHQ